MNINKLYKKTVYDYLVIGAGSGGLSSIKRASKYGVKCILIEKNKIGGTCVNYGCIPKKIIWNASNILKYINLYSSNYEIEVNLSKINWNLLTKKIKKYIKSIRKKYLKIIKKNNIDYILGKAKFINSNLVKVNNFYVKSKKILISTGSISKKNNFLGHENCLDFHEILKLKELPKSVAIIGSGYIATETACTLSNFGIKIYLIIRKNRILKKFDKDVINVLTQEMVKNKIIFRVYSEVCEIHKVKNKLFRIKLKNKEEIFTECCISAIGRVPNVEGMDLFRAGVKLKKDGKIFTNKYNKTNIDNIYAIGDNSSNHLLTPTAIISGRTLSDRLFSKSNKINLVNYKFTPTVIFSIPPIGSVGYNENDAKLTYGKDLIRVYKKSFNPLFYFSYNKSCKCLIKLICLGKEEKIIGIHGVGIFIDEIIQGFSVLLKKGFKKKDLENSIAIHPTISEEFLTF
ncbi:MAG: glutathione-disulfide reductase [Enterobacteriaceae bacterium]